MKNRELYIDNRLMYRIVFNRSNYSECIYCGQAANSREHVPSKVFLRKPYPNNLSIVPSCNKCNNGFSLDEIFVYMCIERLKQSYYGANYKLPDEASERMEKYKNISDEVDAAIKRCRVQNLTRPYAFTNCRIDNVLEKLALGHAVYELSIGYKSDSWSGKCSSLNYNFLPNLNKADLEEIDSCFILNNQPLPEVGSRAYDHIYVVEATLENGEVISVCLLDWIDVQDGSYRYTSYSLGQIIIVKLVISDFLYAVITFEENQ